MNDVCCTPIRSCMFCTLGSGVLVELYSIYLSLQTFTIISIFQGTFPALWSLHLSVWQILHITVFWDLFTVYWQLPCCDLLWEYLHLPLRQLCQISANAGKPYPAAIYQPLGLHHTGRARTLTHPSESKLIMQIQSCYRKRMFCDSLYIPCKIFTFTNSTASGTGTEFCWPAFGTTFYSRLTTYSESGRERERVTGLKCQIKLLIKKGENWHPGYKGSSQHRYNIYTVIGNL